MDYKHFLDTHQAFAADWSRTKLEAPFLILDTDSTGLDRASAQREKPGCENPDRCSCVP